MAYIKIKHAAFVRFDMMSRSPLAGLSDKRLPASAIAITEIPHLQNPDGSQATVTSV